MQFCLFGAPFRPTGTLGAPRGRDHTQKGRRGGGRRPGFRREARTCSEAGPSGDQGAGPIRTLTSLPFTEPSLFAHIAATESHDTVKK